VAPVLELKSETNFGLAISLMSKILTGSPLGTSSVNIRYFPLLSSQLLWL
jgi:hypothetical protein